MIAVDCPRDVYLATRALRGPRPPVPHTEKDLLDALYLGAGNLGPEPFYAPLWCALEAEIARLEGRLAHGSLDSR